MNSRTALITGASRGLGFAFSAHLARTGWRLVIDARTASDLSVAAQALQDLADATVIAIDCCLRSWLSTVTLRSASSAF